MARRRPRTWSVWPILDGEQVFAFSVRPEGQAPGMERSELERLLKEGLSLAEIARRRGLDPSTVRKAAKRLGVPVPQAQRWVAKPIPLDTLLAEFEGGATHRELAARFGVSVTTVRKHLRRHGLSTKRRRHASVSDDARREQPYEATGKCRRHGTALFQLDARGYYRCLSCRAEAVVRRRKKVKQTLVDEAGRRCVLCGYDRCVRALHFHHRDPAAKGPSLSAGAAIHEGSHRYVSKRASASSYALIAMLRWRTASRPPRVAPQIVVPGSSIRQSSTLLR